MTERYIRKNGAFIDTDNDVMWKFSFESTDGKTDLYTFDEAKARFKGFDEFNGFDDWRLPTLNECKGVLDYKLFRDAVKLDLLFNRLSQIWANGIWSSTPVDHEYAWKLFFKEGEKKMFSTTEDSLVMVKCDKMDKSPVVLCRTVDE